MLRDGGIVGSAAMKSPRVGDVVGLGVGGLETNKADNHTDHTGAKQTHDGVGSSVGRGPLTIFSDCFLIAALNLGSSHPQRLTRSALSARSMTISYDRDANYAHLYTMSCLSYAREARRFGLICKWGENDPFS